jgi:two-component system OmpR family response regulator
VLATCNVGLTANTSDRDIVCSPNRCRSGGAMTGKPHRQSVLQIEDDGPTEHLRAQILRRAGFRVVTVRTVRDALISVAKNRPDVILCDVKLPDGSGFQVCREIRTLHPGLPVVLVSAVYRDEFSKQSSVFTGAADYLVEPVGAADLVAAVRRQT